MKNLETILDKYFEYNTWILLATLTVVLLLITISVAEIINSKIKFKIYPLLEKIYLSFIIIAISVALPLINFKLKNKYIYFNMLFFAIYMLFIVAYIIIHILKHKEYISILCHCISYFLIAIWFQFFLLGVSENLQLLEVANGLAAICLVESLQTILIERNKETPKTNSIESGYPNKDLYGTRAKQLERFINILEQQKQEPYAIMISGEWGTGKTSFVEALQDVLSNHVFIWIKTGGEKNSSEIMKDISNKIIRILKDNNIYIEKSSLIENYFLSFTQLLENVGWGFFNKLTETFGIRPKETNSKTYVNSKLGKLNKTVFLIIDDLDRCDDEYRIKMFKVIRESTELINCKTIFLADDSMFMTDDCNVNYIEKYISYNLRLCKVDYEEIVNYHLANMFDDEFYDFINTELLHELSLLDIQLDILKYPNTILTYLNQQASNGKLSPEESDDIDKTIYKIEKNITNSRKVKNYLKGIKADLLHLSDIWGFTTNEYKSGNWINSILKAEFIKHFLPDDYIQMMEYSNIWIYHNYCKIAMRIILNEKYSVLLNTNKEVEMLNYAIYKLDTFDFSKDKTDPQFYIEELRGISPNILNFEQYLKYVSCFTSYSDYDILLQLYNKSDALTYAQKTQFFKQLLENICVYQIPITQKYYALSKKIAISLMDNKWSKSTVNLWTASIKTIINTCIATNILTLKKPLYIAHGYNFIEQSLTSPISDVNDLYKVILKIAPGFMPDTAFNQIEQLYIIQRYYTHLKEQLINKADNSFTINIENLFERCDLLFQICKLWAQTINNRFSNTKRKNNEPYFDTNILIWEESTFTTVTELKTALNDFEYHIRFKSSIHPSDYAMLFNSVIIRMLDIITKEPEWFEGQQQVLSDKLSNIINVIGMKNISGNYSDQEMIETLKILVYDFQRHCEHLKNNK